ncbi:sulfur carrier protein ThiS [Candidatus Thioglobus sp.]|jgi:sulfur carrier protein|uniref:sulfur carrier protein ThiS n=1 Tax=Candidatus Thioglobus sp. TaxID=2026721 RepID=UPI001E05B3C7|nr:sulfur carrier protein ThiS [Candidatus Thioglobus sp.]MBT3277455.1 sulfur carrier protein ThiS [Candidatus Thioglobus sp.]MBT3447529.1 sulfur carrier protein ThiS [Candidatus Thioglobus sp.]MBT3745411.1 sulfur carrier protein ThiS [Candidatus Thioglobus sp.]MBT4000937.1 sulfur carrier protein ThiS [Candidatus Thioglobus sp.]MBT4181542.1 sulfur carrier protein ThiS [Candidatus Thioglobus sp.]
MIVTVNGQALKIDNSATAKDLISQLNFQDQRIALEVNESIIPKSEHSEFELNENDQIEIIKAVGGG